MGGFPIWGAEMVSLGWNQLGIDVVRALIPESRQPRAAGASDD
jgi:hypothetical protein